MISMSKAGLYTLYVNLSNEPLSTLVEEVGNDKLGEERSYSHLCVGYGYIDWKYITSTLTQKLFSGIHMV